MWILSFSCWTVEQEKAVEEAKEKMLFHSLVLFNSQPLKQSTFSVMNKSRFVLMDVMDLEVISYVMSLFQVSIPGTSCSHVHLSLPFDWTSI